MSDIGTPEQKRRPSYHTPAVPATAMSQSPAPSPPALDPSHAWIALGSNLGDPPSQVARALDALANVPGLTLEAVSTLRVTAPLGPPQPSYTNGVCRVRSKLPPRALLASLQAIEHSAGRVRKIHWGPRTLDLDLVFFATRTLATVALTLPHPSWHERPFVLEPLAELEGPDFVRAMARWQFGRDLALPL